jgi:hypothetical protein
LRAISPPTKRGLRDDRSRLTSLRATTARIILERSARRRAVEESAMWKEELAAEAAPTKSGLSFPVEPRWTMESK